MHAELKELLLAVYILQYNPEGLYIGWWEWKTVRQKGTRCLGLGPSGWFWQQKVEYFGTYHSWENNVNKIIFLNYLHVTYKNWTVDLLLSFLTSSYIWIVATTFSFSEVPALVYSFQTRQMLSSYRSHWHHLELQRASTNEKKITALPKVSTSVWCLYLNLSENVVFYFWLLWLIIVP